MIKKAKCGYLGLNRISRRINADKNFVPLDQFYLINLKKGTS